MKVLAWGGEPGLVALGPEAQGVFAFGQQAHGVFAFGQLATGVFAFGQLATGVVAVGQLARGGIAVGQCALGLVAVGQIAVGVGWAAGLGVGGTAGPGAVFGLFGRVRYRWLAEGAWRLRAWFKRAVGRLRGAVQDAVPPRTVIDRRPWTARRIAGRALRALGVAAIGVTWWFVAGATMVQAARGHS